MIMVAGNCRRIDLAHPGEAIPDRFAFAILERGAFDLRRRSGRPPGEGIGERIAATDIWPTAAKAARCLIREFTGRDSGIHGSVVDGSSANPAVIMFYRLRLHPVAGKNARGNWS